MNVTIAIIFPQTEHDSDVPSLQTFAVLAWSFITHNRTNNNTMSWCIRPLKKMRSLYTIHATYIISCYFISTDCVTSEIYLCSKRMASSVPYHYNDVKMGAMAYHITSLTIVYSTVYSGENQSKHQSSASLAFVREIERWEVNRTDGQ